MFFIPCDIFNNNEEENEEKECFICFEKEDGDGILYLKEIEKIGYIRKCDCNGSIHIHCLSIWYQVNKKCPICRQNMDMKNISNNTTSMIILNLPRYLLFYCNIVWFFIGLYVFIYYLTKANELVIKSITNFSSSKMIPMSCN